MMKRSKQRMRRKGETLTEFLVAMVLFALIMQGVFSFVANQTENAARIKTWDFLTHYAQQWINKHDLTSLVDGEIYEYPKDTDTPNTTERGKIEFTLATDSTTKARTLTAKVKNNDKQSMTFTVGYAAP